MKKNKAQELILEYLRACPRAQAAELAAHVGIQKSTVNTYLQEMETAGQVLREKEGYKVFWSERPFMITRSLVLRIPWKRGVLSRFR